MLNANARFKPYMPFYPGDHPMGSVVDTTVLVISTIVVGRDEFEQGLCAQYGLTEADAAAFCARWETEVAMDETRDAIRRVAQLVRDGGALYLENN
jgi:hypothetical protein